MGPTKPRLLLLEDAADVRLIVKVTLSDMDLILAENLAQAREALKQGPFDLYILDVTLPDGNGYTFCREIRESDPDGAIFFLSGKTAEADRLNAFNYGADDYIIKPFSALELKARVQARLRTRAPQIAEDQALVFPSLIVDLERRKAFLVENGVPSPLKLTNLEFKLLCALCRRPEVVKSRQALLSEVWGDNVRVTERSVDVHIYNLRRKLGPRAGLIEASAGNGYSFMPGAQKAS